MSSFDKDGILMFLNKKYCWGSVSEYSQKEADTNLKALLK